MASSSQKINSPSEDTTIISPQSASQYKKELLSKTLTPADRDFKLKKIKQYKPTLSPQWQRKWAEDLSSIEAKMAAPADHIIENNDKHIHKSWLQWKKSKQW